MAEQRVERRLAAILVGDVVGYSRLMGADEEGTLSRFNAHRREFLEPKIAEYRGHIVKRTGDGVLVEFASAVDAARCAVEIQQGMIKRNAPVPQEKRIEIRCGIHIGDIIIEEGDIFGDGVNIAARLEGIAPPGGICISDDAYRQIAGKIDANFNDTGEHKLKNIARPIRVYEWQGGGSVTQSPSLALPDKPSIAVLPFQNLSGDPEQEYFADGMVEDIISSLSRIRWLFVIARNSTFIYKGRSVDVKQVGRELGVRYVLEGSVRKAADRVRITGQLIDASTGAHLWAERYERKFEDIFALQDELTLSIVGMIEPSLLSAEADRAKRKRSDSLDAYDLVLQAQPNVLLPMPENVANALVLLKRALVLDPNYALAHAYSAMCYHSLYLRAGLKEENREASVRHAQQAMLRGQDDALALTLAGFSIGMDGHDRASATAAFEAALTVSPSSALTYFLGSVMFAWGGDAERAIEWGERGIRLSPFDPWRASAYIAIALGHFQRDEFEQSVTAARKSVQFRPGFSISYLILAAPLAKLGRTQEAKNAAAKALELQPALRFSQQFAGVDCDPALAARLRQPLFAAGLPE